MDPQGRAENEANASRRSDGRNVTHGLPAGSYDGPRSHFVPDPGPSHSGNEKQQPHSSQGDVEMTNPLSAGPSDTGFISDISSGRSSEFTAKLDLDTQAMLMLSSLFRYILELVVQPTRTGRCSPSGSQHSTQARKLRTRWRRLQSGLGRVASDQ